MPFIELAWRGTQDGSKREAPARQQNQKTPLKNRAAKPPGDSRNLQFGWLVDVIVFGCLWGISQVSRVLGTHVGGAPVMKIVVLVLVLLLLLYAFYFVFGRFIGVIRWALDRIAYALGVILFSAAVVSGVFASAGLVAAVTLWVMGNINLASR